MQINLTGFLTKDTPAFMESLWKLLLEAQQDVTGVPRTFVEQKKEEMRKAREGDTRAIDERDRRARLDEIRDSERGGRGGGRGGRGDGRGDGRGRGRGGRGGRGGFDERGGDRLRDSGWGNRGGGPSGVSAFDTICLLQISRPNSLLVAGSLVRRPHTTVSLGLLHQKVLVLPHADTGHHPVAPLVVMRARGLAAVRGLLRLLEDGHLQAADQPRPAALLRVRIPARHHH